MEVNLKSRWIKVRVIGDDFMELVLRFHLKAVLKKQVDFLDKSNVIIESVIKIHPTH